MSMMGLAVGIDYCLFILSRYREERESGIEKLQAIINSGSTAGKAVMFSGLTVVFALVGMFVIQEKLNKINIKKQQILIELEQLKNG